MDREAQRRGDTYSGVKGIAMQDASLQESMGPIVDRTKERLVAADSWHHQGAAASCARPRSALRDEGVEPPGVDAAHQGCARRRSCCPRTQSFLESCTATR